jgi:hypothetical protein
LTAAKTNAVARTIAETLDRLVAETERDEHVSFAVLVRKAGLDPAHDFVGAFLADLDFRDEDLRGFDFSDADLTGADFRRANLVGVRFEGAILTGAIGLPTGGPAEGSQSEGSKKMPRARPSGLRLSETQASIVKGMLQRGDRQHDIAGWFGVNSGRIAEVKDGHLHPAAPPASQHELPPRGSPGRTALVAMRALAEALLALEGPGGPERAKKIIEAALGGPGGAERTKRITEAAFDPGSVEIITRLYNETFEEKKHQGEQ